MESAETGTIDTAIKDIEQYMKGCLLAARNILLYLFLFSGILALGVTFYTLGNTKMPESFLYIVAAIFFVVFGVLMAIYRFYLNEIARNQHYRMGFMRIRVAANNYGREGFKTEVRRALTERAFDYVPASLVRSKDQKIESPLPGHPGSDIAAMLIDRLTEKPKRKR